MFFIGTMSLFTAVFNRTKSFLFSLIPPFLFCSSPTFIDYSGGFLADPFSASIVFVSFIPIMKYIEGNETKDMFRFVALLTLATLIKTSSVIYLAGMLAFVFIRLIKAGSKQTMKVWMSFLGAGM